MEKGGDGDGRLGMAGLERSCQCRVLEQGLSICRRGSCIVKVTASLDLDILLFGRRRHGRIFRRDLDLDRYAHRALGL